MDVLNIPGYCEAVLKERKIRDASFLGITEAIGPFEVQPLTLRHWIVLRMMQNPLLFDGTPTPNDLLNFFWLLSPRFTIGNSIRKRWFKWHCRRMFFPQRYLALWNTKRARARFERKRIRRLTVAAKLIDKSKEFLNEALQDRPPIPKTLGFDAEYFSDGAYFCAVFGREFGWSQEDVLNTPIKRLFQYINEMKHYHRSPVPLCNPSDRIKASWLASIQPRKRNG